MKIVEWIIGAVLWITAAIALVFFGWCIKGYCVKKEIRTPLDKAEKSVLDVVERAEGVVLDAVEERIEKKK